MSHNLETLRHIYPLTENIHFSYEQALELIPLMTRITTKTKREINILNSQLALTKKNTPKADEIQVKINTILQSWSEKIRKLGALPVSFSSVRILSNEHNYLWEYPEKNLKIQ